MLIAGLLTLPALGWADDSPAPAHRPSFDIHGPELRKVIRDTAASQYGSYDLAPAQTMPTSRAATPALAWQQPERAPAAEAPRPSDQFDCEADDCVPRAQQHAPAIYTFASANNGDTRYSRSLDDAWLACQSRDDLLTTQQRYQNCKVGIDDGKSFTESLRDDLIDRFVGALFGLW